MPVVLEAGASLGAGVDGEPALVSSTMGSLAAATPSSHDELPGASSPLAGKRRDPESFFFFFLIFLREGYSLHKCND